MAGLVDEQLKIPIPILTPWGCPEGGCARGERRGITVTIAGQQVTANKLDVDDAGDVDDAEDVHHKGDAHRSRALLPPSPSTLFLKFYLNFRFVYFIFYFFINDFDSINDVVDYLFTG